MNRMADFCSGMKRRELQERAASRRWRKRQAVMNG